MCGLAHANLCVCVCVLPGTIHSPPEHWTLILAGVLALHPPSVAERIMGFLVFFSSLNNGVGLLKCKIIIL